MSDIPKDLPDLWRARVYRNRDSVMVADVENATYTEILQWLHGCSRLSLDHVITIERQRRNVDP
jgi:hypothetical protein